MTLQLLLAPAIGSARGRARAELLERALTAELGRPVVIRVASSYGDLEKEALSGSAHLVWAPPAVCAKLEPSSRRIFKSVRHGQSVYRSAIVVRTDEQRDLDGLSGLRAVWVDRLSMGGHLLARHHMRDRGMDPMKIFREQRFVGSYPETLREVLFQTADVTAVTVYGEDREDLDEALAGFAGRTQALRLAALAVTRECPTDALVLTGALTPAQVAHLLDRLFPPREGGRSPAGLCLAFEAEGFVEADAAEYADVRKMLEPDE